MMNQTVFRARLITALLFLFLGLITLWQSANLTFGSLSHIRTGFFPIVFGSLLTGLSVVFLTTLIWLRYKGKVSQEKADGEDGVHLSGFLAFVGIFLVFLLLTKFVGFVIASFAAVLASSYLLGLKGWRLLALSVLTTLFIWLLFDIWLKISLPVGIWFE